MFWRFVTSKERFWSFKCHTLHLKLSLHQRKTQKNPFKQSFKTIKIPLIFLRDPLSRIPPNEFSRLLQYRLKENFSATLRQQILTQLKLVSFLFWFSFFVFMVICVCLWCNKPLMGRNIIYRHCYLYHYFILGTI